MKLACLYGGTEVIAKARQQLPELPVLGNALNELEALVQALPEYDFSVDLADMGSGYGYHSGVVFSIYAQGWHDALVRCGRYDGVGRPFGRSCPDTGFITDLLNLSSGLPTCPLAKSIRSPSVTDAPPNHT